jgi:hypothetical protein
VPDGAMAVIFTPVRYLLASSVLFLIVRMTFEN